MPAAPAAAAPFEALDSGVYLRAYLSPFSRFLQRPDVTEILVNRPGEVWIERVGHPCMELEAAPEVDEQLMQRLAAQIARASHQGVNRESPLLAATLPGGERVQLVGPPATRGGWIMAIRRHLPMERPLESYDLGPLPPLHAPARRDDADAARADPIGFLKQAVADRRTILVSGGTSSGKTTFLNALLRLTPASERILVIEDTPEIMIGHANHVGLVAVKGELGEARVSLDDLVQASLRLRPDRLVVGEIRGREVVSFLRAVNTGHPGSFTTVHANSPEGALEQIAFMALQTGMTLPRAETIAYVRSVVDVVVQLGRAGGERRILDIRVH